MLLICAIGLGAGVLGGVIGFGTTILLMPPLVHFYGPMQTVPMIALVAIVANLRKRGLWCARSTGASALSTAQPQCRPWCWVPTPWCSSTRG